VRDLDVLEDFIVSSKSKHENNEVFTILELNFLAEFSSILLVAIKSLTMENCCVTQEAKIP
jgi:hypothetical protein